MGTADPLLDSPFAENAKGRPPTEDGVRELAEEAPAVTRDSQAGGLAQTSQMPQPGHLVVSPKCSEMAFCRQDLEATKSCMR